MKYLILNKGTIANIAFVLTVFCFIQIYPGPEVQPLSFIIGFFWCILKSKYYLKNIYYIFLVFFSILLTHSVIHSYFFDINIVIVIETALSILLFYSGFIYFINNVSFVSWKTFYYLYYIWVVVALVQIFLGNTFLGSSIGDFIRIFIPRYSNGLLSEWDRGATLLAPEPSYSAHTIFMFFSLYVLKFKNFNFTIYNKFFFYLSLIVLIYSNRSGTLFAILITYLTFSLIFNIKNVSYKRILLYLALGVILINVPLLSEIRAFSLFYNLVIAILEDGLSESTTDLILNFSGIRNVSVYVGYASIFNPKQLYFGSWGNDFINQMYLLSLDPVKISFFSEVQLDLVNIKPYSPIALMAFDYGLLGLTFISFFILFPILKIIKLNSYNSQQLTFIFVSLFYIFFGQPITLPFYILIIAFSLSTVIPPIKRLH